MVWYLARNPAVAMELMRCNLVPVLYHGLAKQDVSDQLPLIGEGTPLFKSGRDAVVTPEMLQLVSAM